MNKEFSPNYRFFGSKNSWRIERKKWTDLENQEHETDSVVSPRVHVRIDQGMSYREAIPTKIEGDFTIGLENGYCIWTDDAKGRPVCNIPLKNEFIDRRNIRDELELEESIWLAEKIVELLNSKKIASESLTNSI